MGLQQTKIRTLKDVKVIEIKKYLVTETTLRPIKADITKIALKKIGAKIVMKSYFIRFIYKHKDISVKKNLRAQKLFKRNFPYIKLSNCTMLQHSNKV